jgi:membrane dipeptidase
MRKLISLFLIGSLAGCSAPEAPPAASISSASDTVAVHERVLALDTHVDIPLDFATDNVDPLSADEQVNLQKMRSGGLDAAFFIVYVGQTQRTPANYEQAKLDAMTKFDAIHRMTDTLYPDRIGLAYTPDDVTRLVESGKLAAVIGIENGYVIGKDLDLIDRYFDLGARYMTLVHNGHNDIADSAQPRAVLGDGDTEHDGVSDFGAAVIARMNNLGMMVDVSHASKRSALDAMRLSRAPVIASHSSVAGVAAHPRNMDDETLLALAANGGVIQIVAFSSYLLVQPPEREAAMRALEKRLGLDGPTDPATLEDDLRMDYLMGIRDIQRQWREPDVSDLVNHIDYAVKLIGIDHVGLSSDFGGGGGIIGWSDATETRNVTAELLARGYSESDIGKIWSGNVLRVWAEVADIADKI